MKPIPTPKNVVTQLRAMHQRLSEGWPHADDAWWTSEAAAIIERLVHQRNEAMDKVSLLRSTVTDCNIEIEQLRKERDEARSLVRTEQLRYLNEIERLRAERDEARREVCANDADTAEDQREYAKQRGWDCCEEAAREHHA